MLSALAFRVFFVGTDAASGSGGVAWFTALALVTLVGRRAVNVRSADLRPG